MRWLAAAGGAGAVGVILAVFASDDNLGLGLAAWFVAGPVGIILASIFVSRDTAARAGVYTRAGWVGPAYVAALIVCGAGIVAGSIRIALWMGRHL